MSDCHHCNEPTANGRCWWCGGPVKSDSCPTDAEVNLAIDELAELASRAVIGTSGHAYGKRMEIRRLADMLKNALADDPTRDSRTDAERQAGGGW